MKTEGKNNKKGLKTGENDALKPAAEGPSSEVIWVKSLAELAFRCGKTVPTILSYRTNHGAPTEKVPGKGYNVTALREWMDAHGYIPRVHPRRPIGIRVDEEFAEPEEPEEPEESEEPEEEEDESLSPARRAIREKLKAETKSKKHPRERLLQAQAVEKEARGELAKLKLAVERGEYIPKDDVKHRDIARIQAVKRGLFGLVRSLPPRLVGLNTGEMEPVIKEQVRELLTRFSQM